MYFTLLRLSLLAALCVVAAPPAAWAAELVSATIAAKPYPGSRDRRYRVFIPSAYDGRAPVAMLMVLHGCRQTEQDIILGVVGLPALQGTEQQLDQYHQSSAKGPRGPGAGRHPFRIYRCMKRQYWDAYQKSGNVKDILHGHGGGLGQALPRDAGVDGRAGRHLG